MCVHHFLGKRHLKMSEGSLGEGGDVEVTQAAISISYSQYIGWDLEVT